MTKKELLLLERVFESEIEGALTGNPGLFQTKSKLAAKLVADGYLRDEQIILSGRLPVRVRGYVLTERGRTTYCRSQGTI